MNLDYSATKWPTAPEILSSCVRVSYATSFRGSIVQGCCLERAGKGFLSSSSQGARGMPATHPPESCPRIPRSRRAARIGCRRAARFPPTSSVTRRSVTLPVSITNPRPIRKAVLPQRSIVGYAVQWTCSRPAGMLGQRTRVLRPGPAKFRRSGSSLQRTLQWPAGYGFCCSRSRSRALSPSTRRT